MMSKEQEEKKERYLKEMLGAIDTMFQNTGIDKEFKDSENLTLFVYVLTSLVPAIFVSKKTDRNISDLLELNYQANRLIFRFCKKTSL
jgi:hypothetical protein|nr:MAG TPA: hypothetical protein [Caudoviricetes sp.]